MIYFLKSNTLTLRHRILDTIVPATVRPSNNSDRVWDRDVVPSEPHVLRQRHSRGLEFCPRRALHKCATVHRVFRHAREHADVSEYHSLLRLSLSTLL